MNAAPDIRIRRITEPADPADQPGLAQALADVLLDCVAGGASIGFMLPLSREKAVAFWQGVLAGVARKERILLVAEEAGSGTIVGTVQVVLTTPENQPHRADIAKMQVHRRARRRGVGAALLRAAEAAAAEAGRTVLVLDTVAGGDAERLYARLGWQRCGVIPNYALWPGGGYCSTTVFYRILAPEPPPLEEPEKAPELDVPVIGVDHIYFAVSDLARSERFYDRLMGILGFRKNSFSNDGDPHVQYFNRHFGLVLRPARAEAERHDSLAPGLHHLCLRVEDSAAVKAVAERFRQQGIECSPPQLYPEYAPDYYALFLSDPDGIRLEVTNYRQERRQRHDHWEHVA